LATKKKHKTFSSTYLTTFTKTENNWCLPADRPPRDLEGMEERLLSRFKWGLSADLQVPDFETRIAILEKKMYADGIELPSEVVEFVAYNINTNIARTGSCFNLFTGSSIAEQKRSRPRLSQKNHQKLCKEHFSRSVY
jgi:chromosomal replication initiation ATPase DnaA